MAIRETHQYEACVKKEDDFAFYRLGEQYYLACVVTYELDRDGLTCGGLMYGEDVKIPISVKREPVRKKILFSDAPAYYAESVGGETTCHVNI